MLRPHPLLLFAVLSLVAHVHAQTGSTPATPIRAFDVPTVERLGAAIYRHDVAAARATDALLLVVPDPGGAGVRGWVVNELSGGERVRFVRVGAAGPEAAYDVDVRPGAKPLVSTPTDRALTAPELAAFAARETAARAVGPVCRSGYNTVVLPDPDGEGLLVWLLAPSPAAGVIPVGGHYRFTISANGRTVERRDALFSTCLTLDPSQGVPKGASPVAALTSHVVSSTPVETHVFLQRLYGTSLYVAAGDRVWAVERGRVRQVRQPSRR